MPADPNASVKAYAYIRFGIDSANYYEYRTPLQRGWQEVEINLEELTAIKQDRDSINLYRRVERSVRGKPGDSYAIKGNPILTRVRFFGLGISNPSKSFQELTTTMWVNELRLVSPESSADWAGVGSFNMKLADLGTISANFRNQQPNFHRLEDRFGDRVSSTNWSVTMQGDLDKFAPKSFKQMKIPITYTHSEIMDTPEYMANNDINLNEAATQAYEDAIEEGKTQQEAEQIQEGVIKRSQSLRVQDSWALTGIKLGIPVDHWLMNYSLNALTVGYSYSQEYTRTPVYQERFNWQWRLDTKYSISFPKIAEVSPMGFLEDVPLLNAYKDVKYNFLPDNFSASLNMTRRRQTEKSRFLDFPSPVIRDFSAQRSASFNWKFTEKGFLNPIFDYNFNTNSTLVPFELDDQGQQRSGSEIAQEILFTDGEIIDFGKNNLHNQTVTLNLKPQLPDIYGINKYVNMTGVFNTTYNWRNPMQPNPEIRDIAKNASYNNNIRLNATIRLKSAADDIFGQSGKKSPKEQAEEAADTTGPGLLFQVGNTLKTVFFGWDKLDLSFNQNNSSINPGVFGGNGLTNFWRGMAGRGSQDIYGPNFAYQLGLISNPHGGFDLTSSDKFPYFGFDTYTGLRPPDGVMQDNFKQRSSLEVRTSRPLWKNATLDMNWKSELGFNENKTVTTDENGVPSFSNIMATESFNRTFLTFPSVFGSNLFGNTIENVVDAFNQQKVNIVNSDLDTLTKNRRLQEALSNSFFEELEAFSFTSGRVGKFLPSFNWVLRWEGLEEYPFIKDYVKRMTFEHSYVSTYQENAQITDKGRNVQNQVVQYGFQPLLGLTASFDEEKMGGTLTATLRWSNNKSFNLTSSNRSTISSQTTNEITAQASYTQEGFSFPLFGINLENDLEYSFLFTYKGNNRATYNVLDPETYEGENNEGTTLDGNTQIIVEPRIRYQMSNIVTASLFVRYEGTFTEGAAQPGYHTTQFGLDIRMSISGGR